MLRGVLPRTTHLTQLVLDEFLFFLYYLKLLLETLNRPCVFLVLGLLLRTGLVQGMVNSLVDEWTSTQSLLLPLLSVFIVF